MANVGVTYFTCTLGQAAQRRQEGTHVEHSAKTVMELVDEQARLVPQRPALGFAFTPCALPLLMNNNDTLWQRELTGNTLLGTNSIVTFQGLRDASISAAQTLSRLMEPRRGGDGATPTVGLLCTSSAEFVSTLLGLMRSGWSVLLLA